MSLSRDIWGDPRDGAEIAMLLRLPLYVIVGLALACNIGLWFLANHGGSFVNAFLEDAILYHALPWIFVLAKVHQLHHRRRKRLEIQQRKLQAEALENMGNEFKKVN